MFKIQCSGRGIGYISGTVRYFTRFCFYKSWRLISVLVA